jgi:hypothetical protein
LARRHECPEEDCWSPLLIQTSGYSHAEAKRAGELVAETVQEPLPLVGTKRLTALTRKYASPRYREVSAMSCLRG